MNILERIYKPETAFYAVLGLIIFVSTPHLASTYQNLNVNPNYGQYYIEISWIFGIAFSIFLELGIMYFALHNKRWPTLTFMIISFCLTLGNYQLSLTELSLDNLNGILISISTPILIFLVSDNVKLNAVSSSVRKLEPEKVKAIMEDLIKKVPWDQIAKNHSVSKSTVNKINKSLPTFNKAA